MLPHGTDVKSVLLLSPINRNAMFDSFQIYQSPKLSPKVFYAFHREQWVVVKTAQPQPQAIRVLKLLQRKQTNRVISHLTLYMTSNRENNYLLMQMAPGRSLKSFLEHTQLTPQLYTKMIRDICLAYRQLYIRQIVHRKLTLQNILVFKDTLKIANFDQSEIVQVGHHQQFEQCDQENLKSIVQNQLLNRMHDISGTINEALAAIEFCSEPYHQFILNLDFVKECTQSMYPIKQPQMPKIATATWTSQISCYNIDTTFLYSNHALLFILRKLLHYLGPDVILKPSETLQINQYTESIKALMKATVGRIKANYAFYGSSLQMVEGEELSAVINLNNCNPDYLQNIQIELTLAEALVSATQCTLSQEEARDRLRDRSQLLLTHAFCTKYLKFRTIIDFTCHIVTIMKNLQKLTFQNYHIGDASNQQDIIDSIARVIAVDFRQNPDIEPIQQTRQLLIQV